MPFLLDDTEVNHSVYNDLEAPLGNVPGSRRMRKARSTQRQRELELLRRLQELEQNSEIADLVQASQMSGAVASQSKRGNRKKYIQSRPGRYRFLMMILQQANTSKS
jgi:hypothetical protein